jgi:hypothetical protein
VSPEFLIGTNPTQTLSGIKLVVAAKDLGISYTPSSVILIKLV